jgi:integrase
MTKRKNGLPKYCTIATDRHGKKRIRFRAKGIDTYLPFPPLGEEFNHAYAQALAGVKEWQANIGSSRTNPGTFDALAVSYYRSAKFTGQKPVTQQTYKLIIERFRAKHGKKLIRDLKREHVNAIIGGMSKTPTAANRLLSLLNIMLRHAVDNGWLQNNPALNIKGFSKKTDGFHSWTDKQIDAFLERHATGSKARLAFVLLLYTAQRRGDVVRMGWNDVQNGRIIVKQSKTSVRLEIALAESLFKEIEFIPKTQSTFLQTEFRKPFTADGFGNWFRERCDEAGLKGCSAHGLRKAAARILAEAGISADGIKSVTGHTNLKTLSIYTAAASQVALADIGIAAIQAKQSERTLSNQSEDVGQNKE